MKNRMFTICICIVAVLAIFSFKVPAANAQSSADNCTVAGHQFARLNVGASTTGRISSSAPYTIYCVVIDSAPTNLSFTMTRSSGDLDSEIGIIDTDANVLAAGDDIDPGVIQDSWVTYRFTQRGTFLVLATRFHEQNGDTTGSFRLNVSNSTTPPSRYCGDLFLSGQKLYKEASYRAAWVAFNGAIIQTPGCAPTYLYLGLLNLNLYKNCSAAIANWTLYAGIKYPGQDLGDIIDQEPTLSTAYFLALFCA